MARHAGTLGAIAIVVLLAGCNLFEEVSSESADSIRDVGMDTAVDQTDMAPIEADAGIDMMTPPADMGMDAEPPPDMAPAPVWMPPGPVYFVATDGDDGADGSESAPWQTLTFAISQLQPNDTLYIRGGTYNETITVDVDGFADQPIHIRAHPGEEVVIADVDRGFDLGGVLHVHFFGLTFRDPIIQWGRLNNCENVIFDSVTAEVTRPPDNDLSSHDGVTVSGSTFIIFRDMNMAGWRLTDTGRYDGHALVIQSGSRYVLIDGGFYGESGDAPIELVQNEFTFIRNVRVNNPWDICIGSYGASKVWIEGNQFENCGAQRSGSSGSGIYVRDGREIVIRNNIIAASKDQAILVEAGSDSGRVDTIRIAHNSLIRNNSGGSSRASGIVVDDDRRLGVDVIDVVLRNNIIAFNEQGSNGNAAQLFIRDIENPNDGDVVVDGNIITNERDQTCAANLGMMMDGDGACPVTVHNVGNGDLAFMRMQMPMEFDSNLEEDPLFASLRLDEIDLSLRDSSPAVDAAVALATVVGDGTSDVIEVTDAAFFRGELFGLVDPEMVMIGDDEVGIISADIVSKTLVLEREIDFADGDEVSFVHMGEGADIGAVESR